MKTNNTVPAWAIGLDMTKSNAIAESIRRAVEAEERRSIGGGVAARKR